MKKLSLLLGSLLFGSTAFAAAPTFDETPTGVQNTGVTTHGVAEFASVTGGAFKLIVSRESGQNLLDTCSSVTGGNMPLITDGTDTASISSAGSNSLEVFGLANLTAGAVAQSCTSSAGTTTRIIDAVYDGVHTTVPYGNVVIGTFASTTTPSIAITTTWTDALVLCIEIHDTSGTSVPGDTETSRQTYDTRMNLQDIDATTPGAFTCNWTIGASSNGAMVAIELKSTTSALGGVPTFTAAPAIGTRTTSAIPITFTSDSTGTVYGVRMTDGSSTPTCDAIEAQTVTGGLTYFSEAVVATVGDTEEFGSLTSGTVVDLAFCIESAGGDSTVATIANAYKLPAFTTDISVASQTASAYTTNSKTLDGAGTVTLVACAKDATPPTVAQVNAATGGCILYSQTDDATGAMTLTIGGTPRPVHDLYWTGTYGSQVEAAVHSALDEFLDPPSGYSTWLTLASIGAGSFCEAFNTAVTPDLVAGDIIGIPSIVSPGGFTLFNDNTCQVAYDPVGDFSRQSALNWLVYDTSAAAYHASDIDAWFYTQNPNCSAPFNRVIKTDTALSAAPNLGNIDILGGCTHPLGDTLAITQTAGTLSTGLTLTTGVISGTVAGANEDEDGAIQEFTATSTTDGTSTTQAATLFPWTTLVLFDCTTGPETQNNCENGINTQFLDTLTIDVSTVCDPMVAVGSVVSQAPAAAVAVAPFTTVDLVVSSVCIAPLLQFHRRQQQDRR